MKKNVATTEAPEKQDTKPAQAHPMKSKTVKHILDDAQLVPEGYLRCLQAGRGGE